MKDDALIVYMIIVMFIVVIIKHVRPFKTNYKLQRFTPLFQLFIIPLIVKIPFNISKPIPYILALILIIYSIWGVRKNFKADKGNTDTE